MVQAQIVTHIKERPQSPTFGVRYPIDAAVNARVHHKPCTHEIRLKRHIDHAVRKVPAPELSNRFYHRTELRMDRGIMVELTAVMYGSYSFSIADDGDTLPEPPPAAQPAPEALVSLAHIFLLGAPCHPLYAEPVWHLSMIPSLAGPSV